MAQPQPPVPQALGPRTYREFYSDASRDPWGGDYTALLGQYATTAATTPEQLLVRTLSYSQDTPQAFAMLAAGRDPALVGRIVLMHRPIRFPISVPPTQWDEMVMALEGDVLGGQICTTVEWPAAGLRQAANGGAIQVPTLANLDALFDGGPDVEVVGPYAANEVGTELIRTRNVMFVPPRYIPTLLGQSLTPRQAYLRLVGAVRTDGFELACAPLLDYLRAACTLPAGQPVPAVQRPAANVLRMDETLHQHIRENVVHRDLPRLRQPELLEPGLHVARAIGDLVTEHRATRADTLARRLEEATITPETKWGASLQLLTRLTQQGEHPVLPQFWIDLAAAPKRFEGTTIARATDATAVALGLAPDLAPVITPALVAKIAAFSFGHANSDELEQGINPFTVGYRNQDETTEARTQATQHAMLMDGAAPRLADVITLAASEKVRMPRTCIQVSITLDNYRVMLHTCFGPDHRLTAEFDYFTASWKARAAQFEASMGGEPLIPLYVVRWVQLRLNMWFQDQARLPVQVSVPDLQELFQDYRLENPWYPRIPAAYVTRSAVPAPTIVPVPGRIPTTPPPASPAAAAGGGAAGGGGGTSTMVRNESPNAALLPWKATPGRLRDILRPAGQPAVTIPRNDAGLEMCVAWHVRHMCSSQCSRQRDHKAHSTGERARLLAWCRATLPTTTTDASA